jgi:hypothetical protein
MNPYYGNLDQTPVTDPDDSSRVSHYAIVPVTIAGLTEDKMPAPPAVRKP